jgi:YidC/Oxa1 family membrane protein insertase
MDRSTIIAIVLIGLVIILMPVYYRWISPPKPPETQQTQAPQNELQPGKEPETPGIGAGKKERVSLPSGGDTLQRKIEGNGFPTSGIEELVEVTTDKLTMTFSSKGARLVRCLVHGYPSHLGGDVQIIREAGGGNLVASFGVPGRFLETADIYFAVDKKSLEVKQGEAGSLVFRAEGSEGRVITERYEFYGDRYEIKWGVEARGVGSGAPGEEAWLWWKGGLAGTEADTLSEIQYSRAYALYGKDLIKYDVGKKDSLKTGDTKWVAIRNRYFETAMILREAPAVGFMIRGERDSSGSSEGRGMQEKIFHAALIDPLHGTEYQREVTVYLGPMDYWAMKAQGDKLEKTLDWGWDIFRLTVPILWVMKVLHKVIPNYGIVLIVFSVLVKVVVWPLTHKSHESMKRMQMLQPYLKELKEKYKKDMQRLQRETMKLYKEHKVNPMGGCLPLLIQMPLFIALFSVFRSTIELRGASFVWWIKDLSAPDYVFHLPFSLPMYGAAVAILPLVMGVSSYFQSKISVTDPNQKMMLYFMPVFLVAIFNKMPSGLTLYYTLFNVLTLVQQHFVKPKDLAPVEVPETGGKRAKLKN